MSAPAKLALFPRRTRLALRIVVVVVTAAVVAAVAAVSTVVVAVTAVVVVAGGGYCVCVCGGIVYDYNIFHSILAGDS